MSFEGGDQLSGFEIPDAKQSVPTSGCEPFSIGVKAHAENRTDVTEEVEETAARVEIPDGDRAVDSAPGREEAATPIKGCGGGPTLMAGKSVLCVGALGQWSDLDHSRFPIRVHQELVIK